MQVIRTYVPNSLQNYNHLVVCEQTGNAAAVDPFDADHLITLALEQEVTIAAIWVTHEHGDHTRHVAQLQQRTGARVYAPAPCQGLFTADVWLDDGDSVELGEETAEFWLTPGHTPGHGVFYVSQASPVLICGDTLFNSGVGNTRSGSTDVLFQSIERIRERTHPDARIFPGHDYLPTNIAFTLSLLPNLPAALKLQEEASQRNPDTRTITTMGQEHEVNVFLRLDDPALGEVLKMKGFDTSSREDRFMALRRLRDQW